MHSYDGPHFLLDLSTLFFLAGPNQTGLVALRLISLLFHTYLFIYMFLPLPTKCPLSLPALYLGITRILESSAYPSVPSFCPILSLSSDLP